jgi:hypothetical protein
MVIVGFEILFTALAKSLVPHVLLTMGGDIYASDRKN